jgi:predicted choloylglycine hydrolase
MVGALDGINDAGLAVSLSFGGRKETGLGFGAPMIVRYLLEFCHTVHEAAEVMRRIPVHMAYNIMLVDADGDYLTAFTSPDSPTIVRRTPATTNHQDRVQWVRHAEATDTLARERRLYELLADRSLNREAIIGQFLQPPLFQTEYRRGYGTLYTAAYDPVARVAEYVWPNQRWMQRFDSFHELTHSRSVGDLSAGDSLSALP